MRKVTYAIVLLLLSAGIAGAQEIFCPQGTILTLQRTCAATTSGTGIPVLRCSSETLLQLLHKLSKYVPTDELSAFMTNTEITSSLFDYRSKAEKLRDEAASKVKEAERLEAKSALLADVKKTLKFCGELE